MIKQVPITAYVPHRGAMLLLNRMQKMDDTQAIAEVVVPFDGLFVRRGQVPAWVGIEYMAQTVAAWSARHAAQGLASSPGGPVHLENGPAMDLRAAKPRLGFLLGCRRFEADCSGFAIGSRLEVRVQPELMAAQGMALFECQIWQDDVCVATARLSIKEMES